MALFDSYTKLVKNEIVLPGFCLRSPKGYSGGEYSDPIPGVKCANGLLLNTIDRIGFDEYYALNTDSYIWTTCLINTTESSYVEMTTEKTYLDFQDIFWFKDGELTRGQSHFRYGGSSANYDSIFLNALEADYIFLMVEPFNKNARIRLITRVEDLPEHSIIVNGYVPRD